VSPDRSGDSPTVARLIAQFLEARGVERVYGLCGGHIQPIWDEVARLGIGVVDVRHECAAIYMAHAEAELHDRLAVAMVTAGPGLTNAITGIANASKSCVPVLVIAGRPPRPQAGMGALQDMPQASLVSDICRRTEEIYEQAHVLPRLDGVVDAALGAGGPAGPAYIDFPTDLLRESVSGPAPDRSWMQAREPRVVPPDPRDVEAAAQLIREARRPLVISGRAARRAPAELRRLLDRAGALYLDTAESRGALPSDHPAAVPAMRGRAMCEADLVITVGRRLDFQLAYGSRSVFHGDARFIRIGPTRDDTAENRRGDVELRADAGLALQSLLDSEASPSELDNDWVDGLVQANASRREKLAEALESPEPCEDGAMHPYALIAALNRFIDDDTIVIADGGDILSFARVALKAPTYLDPGPLGCLGVGVPFAVSAALNFPGRRVVSLVGDGSFGFTAMEIDTAVRTGARAVFVVANNAGWNIERQDQLSTYGGNVVGVELPGCRYDLLGEALGAHAEQVEHSADLDGALQRAFENAPAVVDVTVSRDPVSGDFTSGLAGVPDRQALTAWDDAERLQQ
jgi:thiamine pyrophosphate-dependent acetolactate synthase large subunit-like protein